MKLISMVDFVLDLGKTNQIELSNEAFIDVVLNYANFLKQPMTLGMFVPCDEYGSVLYTCGCSSDNGCCIKEYNYKQAKDCVLFDGFEVVNNMLYKSGVPIWVVKDLFQSTIEDLVFYEPTLTPQSLKQIGL